MKKSVAICGTGKSLEYFDYNRNIEVWGLNCSRKYKRFDLMFDLHHKTKDDEYLNYFNSIVQKNYPLKSAIKLRGKRFFSTVDYMIAYAILKKYDVIELYGVDLNFTEEIRTNQRNSVLEWINFAKNKGIQVIICPASPLNKDLSFKQSEKKYLYAFEQICYN